MAIKRPGRNMTVLVARNSAPVDTPIIISVMLKFIKHL